MRIIKIPLNPPLVKGDLQMIGVGVFNFDIHQGLQESPIEF
jgi:hypothetical protein